MQHQPTNKELVENISMIILAPSMYFFFLSLIWISANSFKVSSAHSVMDIVVNGNILSINYISSSQMIHLFSVSSFQEVLYQYFLRLLFLKGVATSSSSSSPIGDEGNEIRLTIKVLLLEKCSFATLMCPHYTNVQPTVCIHDLSWTMLIPHL